MGLVAEVVTVEVVAATLRPSPLSRTAVMTVFVMV